MSLCLVPRLCEVFCLAHPHERDCSSPHRCHPRLCESGLHASPGLPPSLNWMPDIRLRTRFEKPHGRRSSSLSFYGKIFDFRRIERGPFSLSGQEVVEEFSSKWYQFPERWSILYFSSPSGQLLSYHAPRVLPSWPSWCFRTSSSLFKQVGSGR